MRMHRGSSKGAAPPGPPPETLPLSASPPGVRITVELTRAGRVELRELEVPSGTLVRAMLRAVGQRGEGCAVLVDGTPIPLDTPLTGAVRLTVVPTFSGG